MAVDIEKLRARRIYFKRQKVERRRGKRPGQLTPEEQACTLVALKFMVAKVGSRAELAFKMGVDRTALRRALKGKPSIGMALDLARVAGVTVDDVITGNFPAAGACAMCGRAG
jgi:hypothetical protein